MDQPKMGQNTAIHILVNAAEAACQKGVFTLKDAKLVAEAVEVFQVPETPEEVPATPEQTKVSKKKK